MEPGIQTQTPLAGRASYAATRLGERLPGASSLPWEGGATPRCPSIHPSLLPASGLALGEENLGVGTRLPSCPVLAAEPWGGHVSPAAAFCSGGAARAAWRPAGTRRRAGSGSCRPYLLRRLPAARRHPVLRLLPPDLQQQWMKRVARPRGVGLAAHSTLRAAGAGTVGQGSSSSTPGPVARLGFPALHAPPALKHGNGGGEGPPGLCSPAWQDGRGTLLQGELENGVPTGCPRGSQPRHHLLRSDPVPPPQKTS